MGQCVFFFQPATEPSGTVAAHFTNRWTISIRLYLSSIDCTDDRWDVDPPICGFGQYPVVLLPPSYNIRDFRGMLYLSKKLKLRISYIIGLRESLRPIKTNPKLDVIYHNTINLDRSLSRYFYLDLLYWDMSHIFSFIFVFLDEESTTRALITAPNARKTPIVV